MATSSRSKKKPLLQSSRLSFKQRLVTAVMVVALVALSGAAILLSTHAAPANFVYRNGNQLMLNGSPYKFVGYNYFGLTGCADGSPDSTTAINQYFSGLRPLSTTRTWAFQPFGTAGIDAVVASAEKYNQKVIFALADGADFCNDSGHNATFYKSGYTGAYYSWVTQVVSRYKNSPAVLAWEEMNEPCHDASGVTQTDMQNFFENTAKHIKASDPNHLVFTGSLAEYDCGGAMNNFAAVHSGADIDGGSLHEYDYLSVGETGASGHWDNVRPALQNTDNKVAYVGEVGVGPDGSCLSDSQMASATKTKLDAYMNAGASGVLMWGFDDQKVCGIYSGRQNTFNDATWTMMKSYTNPNLPKPNPGTGGTPTPTPTPTPTATPTPTPTKTPTPTPSSTPIGGTTSVNDTSFTYTGSWSTSTDPAKFDGDDHYSSTTGNTYSLTFSGVQAKIYMAKAPHHGIAGVKIDNGTETLVDLYAATRADQQLVYTSPVLSAGTHTVTVRVTGTHNAASTDFVVNADRIDVVAGAATPTPTPTPGDLNGDGHVNVFDLSTLLSRWGAAGGAGDINGDGTVNIFDLSQLLSRWTG